MQFNKKKILSLLLIILFIGLSFSPIIAGHFINSSKHKRYQLNESIEQIHFNINFSQPIIKEQAKKVAIVIDETNAYIKNHNAVELPCFTKTFTLPFKSELIDVTCDYARPEKIPFITPKQIVSNKNSYPDYIVNQDNIDKNQWYHWEISGGVQNQKHVSFLRFLFYPIKYNETENHLYFCKNVKLSVTYEKPKSMSYENSMYDFLIITPSDFQKPLERLVNHKNHHGIETKLVTLNEIYKDTYFSVQGKDDAEEIKYFIYNAFNEWGITFVLLVGNINKMPIRKTWLGSGEQLRTPLTDLYYADICFGNGSFCSWDSNNNGYYGEIWHGSEDDIVDLYADVYIGRLACNSIFEVNTVINKIITYENDAFGSDWIHNCVLVGGDTHPSHNEYPEGELLIDEIEAVTSTLHHIKLKTSDNTFSADSLNNAINDGAGFFCYAGHGFEIGLSTHPPLSEEWINYNLKQLIHLNNKDKLPIAFFNACLTARLDYNIANLLADIIYFSQPLPKLNKPANITFPILFPCIAWSMVAHPLGGSIASIGATRISYGMIGESGEISGGCCYITLKFFEALSESTYLSELLFSAENDFLNNAVYKDPFIVEEMILLGDPTLKIGGYE